MNNLKFLLLGTSLSCFPVLAFGQCVVTEDCAALGYTASSCSGKGLKCPFGNGWFCAEDESTVCDKNGFKYSCTGTGYSGGSGQPCGGKYKTCICKSGYKWSGSVCKKESCSSSYKYTCTGTGYAGGSGQACNGKYLSCNCASGYEWKDESCQKKEILTGADGDVYKCNGKVVAVKTSKMNFYVAMEDLGYMGWSSGNRACQNYIFCGNLKGILPSLKQLETIYNNKSSLETLLSSNGGKKFSTDHHYWSSTGYVDYSGGSYYLMNMGDGYEDRFDHADYHDQYVRPVLTSW